LGLTAGDIQKTHFDNKLFSFGAELKYHWPNLPSGHFVAAELAFEYIPGRSHEVTRWTSGLYLDSLYSYDDRKEKGQGFSLKCSYGLPCPIVPGVEYFGGLSIDYYSVASEAKWVLRNGLLSGLPGDPSGGNHPQGGPLYPGGSGVYSFFGSQITPGLFVGAKYRVTEDIGVELTLRNFGMRHIDLTPGAYLGSEDFVQKVGSSRGWACAFSISFGI
jgi:hypothetical protein